MRGKIKHPRVSTPRNHETLRANPRWVLEISRLRQLSVVSIFYACAPTGRWIDVVQRTGQPLIISKHGKKVVRLVAELPPQPWKALRGRGKFLSDPFAPAISESEIEALR